MTMLSFVIPCYRSAGTIAAVVGEIETAVAAMPGYGHEIILVNDASPDNTFEVIVQLCAENPRVTGVSLAKNFGQHAALMAGFAHVAGDIVICLDDDGQTPADEAGKLVTAIQAGSDVVYANYTDKKHNPLRNFGSGLNDVMARWMLGKPKNLLVSSYFAARRFVIDEVLKYQNPYPYIIGLILRTTDSIVNVPVTHRSRTAGKSGYTFGKLLALWVNGFTSFSVKPLRIATFIGFLTGLAGFAMLIWTIVNKIITPDVPLGYSSTMATLLFIGGMIMLILGLIGEYVGRMYISVNNAPQYVVRTVIEPQKPPED
ncbi:glycosyltransferase family 2 protein [Ruminococcaceae bacterium OttesenSCG-928-O06]|nr:glycosyltransferase family 2 protein [Ruminococcaceae bacterium OttesenSCG-928-O06]